MSADDDSSSQQTTQCRNPIPTSVLDVKESSLATTSSNTGSLPQPSPSQTQTPPKKPCCFLWKFGVCEPPRGRCRFDHSIPKDDGVTPCGFGATCRFGHAKRVTALVGASYEERVEYWTSHRTGGASGSGTNHSVVVSIGVDAPSQRDATALRSQLEPWPTAVLRDRLVTVFQKQNSGGDDGDGDLLYPNWEGASRTEIMDALLRGYATVLSQQNPQQPPTHTTTTPPNRRRIHIQLSNAEVRPELRQALLEELFQWRTQHAINTRPSIRAKAYMILRKDCSLDFDDDDDDDNDEHDGEDCTNTTPDNEDDDEHDNHDDDDDDDHDREEKKLNTNDDNATSTTTTTSSKAASRKARQAQKKMQQYSKLWNLACQALEEVVHDTLHDEAFCQGFSALAVTYGFSGSPHIDKQNTGPFYGLALGDFGPIVENGTSGEKRGGGGVAVEAAWDTVAVCDSHDRFAKVDGRFPHWVDEYQGERYSLIYYSTTQEYQKPTTAYFGNVVS